MTTFLKTNLKKLDHHTNIVKYRVAANNFNMPKSIHLNAKIVMFKMDILTFPVLIKEMLHFSQFI